MKRFIIFALVISLLPGCIFFTPKAPVPGEGIKELPEKALEDGAMKKGD